MNQRFSSSRSPEILVVENHISLCQSLCEILEFAAYKTRPCANGQVALEGLRQHRHLPQLMLADVLMSPIDGIDLFHAVRAVRRWQSIPYVIMASTRQLAALYPHAKLPFDGYLAKPFDETELISVVTQSLAAACSHKRIVSRFNLAYSAR